MEYGIQIHTYIYIHGYFITHHFNAPSQRDENNLNTQNCMKMYTSYIRKPKQKQQKTKKQTNKTKQKTNKITLKSARSYLGKRSFFRAFLNTCTVLAQRMDCSKSFQSLGTE